MTSAPLKYISTAEAERALDDVLESAQRGPVTIRRNDRDVAVVLSAVDYDRLRSRNVDEFQEFCDRVAAAAAARGLTEEKLAEMLSNEG
jgi:prevent-host-death family protein